MRFKLKLTKKTKKEVNNAAIKAKQEQITLLKEEILINEKDRNLQLDNSRKLPYTRKIEAFSITLNQRLIELEKLEKKLEQEDFAEELFHFFKRLNFSKQKAAYNKYIDQAEKVKIGSFLIHSEGEYKDLEEQFWLWKGIFLSYLDERTTTEIVSPFYNDTQSDVKTLFHDFQTSLFNGYMESEEGNFKHILEEELEAVADALAQKLNTNNIIIPIFLSTKMPNYELIYEFLEKVWQPLYLLLSERENKEHWLKLFIIDNEVEDLDGKDYHVTDIMTSVQYGIPYKLDKAGFNFGDIESWVAFDKHEPIRDNRNVFIKYKKECNGIVTKFACHDDYKSHFASCEKIEVLFDEICEGIPLIEIKLKELVNIYAIR